MDLWSGELVDLVGGDHYVHELLEPLELLAMVEESSVRDAVCYKKKQFFSPHTYLMIINQ